MKTIEIQCESKLNLPIGELNDFQGELKDLSVDRYLELKKSILELGFSEPVSVWNNDDKWWILNGHQRLRALRTMQAEGYEIPEIPVSVIQAKTIKEAKKKVLAMTSQYGEMTYQGLFNFQIGADLSVQDLDMFHFADVDLDKYKEEFFTDPTADESVDPLKLNSEFLLVVKLPNEKIQADLFTRLSGEGFECKIMS
mgnify:CR=1 FL=1